LAWSKAEHPAEAAKAVRVKRARRKTAFTVALNAVVRLLSTASAESAVQVSEYFSIADPPAHKG